MTFVDVSVFWLPIPYFDIRSLFLMTFADTICYRQIQQNTLIYSTWFYPTTKAKPLHTAHLQAAMDTMPNCMERILATFFWVQGRASVKHQFLVANIPTATAIGVIYDTPELALQQQQLVSSAILHYLHLCRCGDT